jgi:hypothetical protein
MPSAIDAVESKLRVTEESSRWRCDTHHISGLVKLAIRVPVREEEVEITDPNDDSLSNVNWEAGSGVDSTVPSIDRM